MATNPFPRISEAEWQVMKVFWQKGPQTANQVVGVLAPATRWSPRTIRTLINRLLRKNALGFRPSGREYVYSPLVLESECARQESRSLLERIYGGSLKPLLVNYLEERRLSRQEIEELRRILDERGRES